MSDERSEASAPSSPSTLEKKCPSGCVERILNYRERNLLIGAARDYCGKKEHSDYKGQAKLDRLTKLICFQETLDYFDVLTDHYDEAVREWKSTRRKYNAWKDLKAGLYKDPDNFTRDFPDVDPGKGIEKPANRAPEITPKESRGEERSFYFPSKLDAWVQDVLKAAVWQALAAEYAVELCSKFGIKDEDA